MLAAKVERQQRQPHEGFVVNSGLEPIIVGTPFNDPMAALSVSQAGTRLLAPWLRVPGS